MKINGIKISRSDAEYPDPQSIVQKKAEILALRKSGTPPQAIADQLGFDIGTINQFLSREKKREKNRVANEEALLRVPEHLRPPPPLPAVFVNSPAFAASMVAAGVLEDPAKARFKPEVPRETPRLNRVDTSEAEAILQGSLAGAARTVSAAVSGTPVDAQSMQASKVLLKKYGLLQEEEYNKESLYIKMTEDELCERNLMALAVVMERRGKTDAALVLRDTITRIKEALKPKEMANANP